MSETTVVRVQYDEDRLAASVGHFVAGHRDHIRASALNDFAAALDAHSLEMTETFAGSCGRGSSGCHLAGAVEALARAAAMARATAAALSQGEGEAP